MADQSIPWWQQELNARIARRAARRAWLARLLLRVLVTLVLTGLAALMLVVLAQDPRIHRARVNPLVLADARPTPMHTGTSSKTGAEGAVVTVAAPDAHTSAGSSGGSALEVTVTDRSGGALADADVRISIGGPVPFSGSALTDGRGVATLHLPYEPGPFTLRIVATIDGNEVAHSTVNIGSGQPAISTSPVTARFYSSDNRCMFDAPADARPVLTEQFSTVNFGGRPFTGFGAAASDAPHVAADAHSTVGMANLNHFDAIITGTFTTKSPGTVRFTVLIDDAFDFGIGNGATRVAGTMSNPPRTGLTALEGLPVIGAFNQGHLEATTTVTVHFPKAGAYPYEIDYAECMAGNEALRLSTAGQFIPTT